jgi:hypothetical protein
MKSKITFLTLLFIAVAVLIVGSYSRANAGAPAQYDVAYAIRVSGTGPMLLKYLGTSGTWQTINVSATNGVVQTTGSGLTVDQGLQLSSTASIAAASGTNALPAGLIGLSSSNTEAISTGTGQGFRNAP